jgi:hypothetical protein
MPDRLTSSILLPAPIVIQERDVVEEKGVDRTREIAALEADNFELRNQIIGLKLHNATLRKMIEPRDQALSEGWRRQDDEESEFIDASAVARDTPRSCAKDDAT